MSRYVGRLATDTEDHDLYGRLSLTYDDPERGLTGQLMAQAALDIGSAGSDRNTFFSLQDTFGQALTGRLYHGFIDVHRYASLPVLRLGRQQIYDTPVLAYFDGLRVETRPYGERSVTLGAYGGLPVYYYKRSSRSSDAVAGLYVAGEAWKGARLRAEWMHLDDTNSLGRHKNDLFGLSLYQDIDSAQRNTRLTTKLTVLEDSARDLRVASNYYDVASGFTFDASYYELFEIQRDLAVPLDPFYSSLLALFPFQQVTILSSKAWQRFLLQGGLDLRRVKDDQDVGAFNRDFDRYYVTTTFDGFLTEGLRLGLTGEVWDSDGNDIQTWGLDLTRDFERDLRLSLGSFYSLFKYDLFQIQETDNVRSYYVDARYSPGGAFNWTMRYEFEDNEFDDFHRIRIGMTWFF